MGVEAKMLEWPQDVADGESQAGGALWTASEIAKATGGTANADFAATGVEIDSRDVRAGDLFVALSGESTDGHRFVEQALAAGAAGALVERPIEGPHVRVRDTMAALEALGAASRRRTAARIVGVTGSVGKTGVKEAIHASLDRASRGGSHRSVKSYNNHVGVPLSLARMAAGSRYGVFEMGMNHAAEISGLTRQVRPDVPVITAIAPAHIENLGSIEAIVAAKAEIFEGLATGGAAIVPADSPHYSQLARAARDAGARVIAFGRSGDANVRLLDAVQSDGGTLITVDMDGRRLCCTVAPPGEHWVSNALCVLATVRAVGADLGAAGLALAELEGLSGRGARTRLALETGEVLLIDESYNANPASMRATLAQLGSEGASRRIAVLGAMKELGEHGAQYHADLAEPLAAARVDHAILVGEEMAPLAQELGKAQAANLGSACGFAHCADVDEAIGALHDFGLRGGDAVLVKGSNSVGLSALITAFTEREKR